MKKNWTVFLPKLGMIVLGNLLYALAVTLFIVPNQLLTGGTTGLALFFYRTAGIPVSVFVCVFNVAMFLLGAWILGKQFAVTTILSTLIYPLLLSVLEHSGLPGIVMEERLTAVLYAGVLIGAGIGIVMRAGASTGGMDIPALILKKKRNINVSATIYLCDCIVLALQMMNTDIHALLYGILLWIKSCCSAAQRCRSKSSAKSTRSSTACWRSALTAAPRFSTWKPAIFTKKKTWFSPSSPTGIFPK